jgi:hypothetical protein
MGVLPMSPAQETRRREEIVGLLAMAVVIGAYFILRYGGLWAESDTGVMTAAIRVVRDNGELAPQAPGVYVNGYGYQVISIAIMAFTGLSVEALQILVYPLLSAVLVLPAWMLYRELTGSARIASLATLLLLLVPEHLFAILRGSHERLDRAFLLTALWLLLRSARFRGDRPRFLINLALVVLMTYGLIATNALFGMSFIVALATAAILSLLVGLVSGRLRPHAAETARLLGWASGAGALLLLLFVLYIYPPFGPSLGALSAIPGKLVAIITSGAPGFDPYTYVTTAWVNTLAFLVLSAMNFVVLGTSVLVWLHLGRSWLRGKTPSSIGIWVLWSLYAAFAMQGAAAILSDQTGSLQGNVQYRAFSVFSTVAVPMVALGLSRWRPGAWQRGAATVLVAAATILALAKSTLEPAVSNKWMFYTAPELQGLRWADNNQRDTDTWVGPDDRLPAAYLLLDGDPAVGNAWVTAAEPGPDVDSFLTSPAILVQSARLEVAMPSTASMEVVYDNGQVQLLHRRAQAGP